jgi:hypothetical protein
VTAFVLVLGIPFIGVIIGLAAYRAGYASGFDEGYDMAIADQVRRALH